MSLMGAVSHSISRFGGDVKVTSGGAVQNTRAIVEPIRYKNRIYIGGQQRSLGTLRREKFLYIGKPEVSLRENASVIESAGGKYIVKRCETYFVQDRAVYVWAILVPFGARREDEYDDD
ncbi:MAG: hypothetical protein IJ598_10290 [Ruminococcus sp.]|nr:hypothetical protein [Ruminococcus sp.]